MVSFRVGIAVGVAVLAVLATVSNPSGTPVLTGLSARRARLTAVTGQAGGRLRAYRLRVARAHVPAARSDRPVRDNLLH